MFIKIPNIHLIRGVYKLCFQTRLDCEGDGVQGRAKFNPWPTPPQVHTRVWFQGESDDSNAPQDRTWYMLVDHKQSQVQAAHLRYLM